MTYDEVIKILHEDGWEEVPSRSGTSHRQFRHPFKKGKVTVPEHKSRDIPLGTIKSIERQSGLCLRHCGEGS